MGKACHLDGEPPAVRKINTRDFRRATRSTPRQVNRQILLNLVREHQPISRADLARRMRIGPGIVTTLVDELLEEGSVYEGASAEAPPTPLPPPSSRGRRPKMLYVRARDRLVVAIDVRFSRTYLLLSDFSGTQIALETFGPIFSPEALLDQLARRVRTLLRTHGAEGRCEGIGMVVPGMVDRAGGRVLNAPQLGWRDVEIRSGLAERTGLPVHVENAPAACALATIWLAPGAGGGAAVEETGRYLGLGLSVIINALNPEQIIVGGEITSAWALVEPAIRAETQRRALTHEAAVTPVIPEPPGSLPRLRGAIALVTSPLFAAPQVG